MLAVLFILGMLCPLNSAEISIQLLDPTVDGVVANIFPNAFLLRWPNCTLYGNKSAELVYKELTTNETKTHSFTVPSCNASLPGLLLQNLKNGTTYIMEYTIKDETQTSAILTNTTTTALAYEQIDSGLRSRSGAMIVITVILSLAMVILLVGLIISIFFS